MSARGMWLVLGEPGTTRAGSAGPYPSREAAEADAPRLSAAWGRDVVVEWREPFEFGPCPGPKPPPGERWPSVLDSIKPGDRVEVRYQPNAPDGWDWRAATVARVIQVGVEVTFDDPPTAHHSWAASWRNVRLLGST